MDVTVTVYPEQGEFPRIAKALLQAADHPYQVVTTSNPRMGFIVPEEVFDRFHQTQAAEWEREDEVPPQEAPAPKRRGRPRKQAAPPAEAVTPDVTAADSPDTASPDATFEHDSEEDNA